MPGDHDACWSFVGFNPWGRQKIEAYISLHAIYIKPLYDSLYRVATSLRLHYYLFTLEFTLKKRNVTHLSSHTKLDACLFTLYHTNPIQIRISEKTINLHFFFNTFFFIVKHNAYA